MIIQKIFLFILIFRRKLRSPTPPKHPTGGEPRDRSREEAALSECRDTCHPEKGDLSTVSPVP